MYVQVYTVQCKGVHIYWVYRCTLYSEQVYSVLGCTGVKCTVYKCTVYGVQVYKCTVGRPLHCQGQGRLWGKKVVSTGIMGQCVLCCAVMCVVCTVEFCVLWDVCIVQCVLCRAVSYVQLIVCTV